jgi:hypothetical protein
MGWTMLYLFVFLKLPIVAACGIIWWAVHQDGDTVTDSADGGSPRPTRPHPVPKRPRPPRRGPRTCGPHACGAASSPPRVRSVTAAGRARTLGH